MVFSRTLACYCGLILLALPADHSGLHAQEVKARTSARHLDRIRVSQDKTHFVRGEASVRFEIWGFNYDHDDAGRLLEDYWRDEWASVEADFREMKALGANVVRIHLQMGRFLRDTVHPDEVNLTRLIQLVEFAEAIGLYLDITGLGCYQKDQVPAWYTGLEESARWDAQARFWKVVAEACKQSPAIFCYDLMNEPILTGGEGKDDWLPGQPLAGKYYVQRITLDQRGRTEGEIAHSWITRLAAAIRSVDDQTLITVGVIPWAQVFPGAGPLFYAPEVGGPLDFVSVHFYPKAGKIDADLAALRTFEVGKPLIIEEISPLTASVEETATFITRSRSSADGWVSFYWGQTAEEAARKGDVNGALTAAWLRRFPALLVTPR